MRVAVIGGNGQLGADVCLALHDDGHVVRSWNHDELEVTDVNSVRKALSTLQLDAVVNTAAYHDVDKCERHPKTAFAVNAIGGRNVALVSEDVGAYLIHVSTDYVFSGSQQRPYLESDLPAPLNVYGNTKLSGEHFVTAVSPGSTVLRTSGLYGRHPCRAKGQNFVDLMLKLASERDEVRVIDNERLTPTSTREAARQIGALIQQPIAGVVHATGQGDCSWYEFADAIFEITGADVTLAVASPDEFPAKVPRPRYSVLENSVLHEAGANVIGPWREALREYLEESS